MIIIIVCVYVQLPSDAVKKLPPPTKAKPKQPAVAQEVTKKPVLPPTAAMATANLANVLKEGRKVTLTVTHVLPEQQCVYVSVCLSVHVHVHACVHVCVV